jgi:hypothetical protein
VCNHGLTVKSFVCARGKRLERRQITKWIGAIRGLHGDEKHEAQSILKLERSVANSRRPMLSKLFEDLADVRLIFGDASTLYCTMICSICVTS